MNKIHNRFAALMAVVGLATATMSAKEYFVKQVVFPEGATIEEKLDMASRLVPSEKQLAWQELELTAFLHFGVNTFTNREWGDGTENPEIFNPSDLDTDQWVKILKDAGFNMVMLTAKHHDGFCLWPTATTEHSVKASPWKDGKGDVVADLANSCRKYDMKLGLYLSPWDRNAECYGDSPKYNDMFVAQLTELLTQYGKVDEVWFDGACGEGPNGKKQVYDWQRFKETIESLMPDAVVAIMGDDVRWVGNEKGLGRETEWSATAFAPGILAEADSINKSLGLFPKAPDLGSREIVAKADRLYWWPSEVDVSIRPGWFYHEKEAPHSLQKLVNIYLNSVGRNSVLLLNIPPDTRGLIADADAARLKELKTWIDDNFSCNLANGKDAAGVKINGNVNAIVIAEDISKGQRVESFDVEALMNGKWQTIASGTTIGKKRILQFDDITPDSMRVNVKEHRATPYVEILGAHHFTMPAYKAPSLPAGYKYISKDKWKSADAAPSAYDGNANVMWTSPEGQTSFSIDLGKKQKVAGFSYIPRQDEVKDAIIFKYRFLVSNNGKDWTEVPTSGEFSNIVNNPIAQTVYFNAPVKARYLKLQSLSTTDASQYITVGDFSAIGLE